MRRFNLLLFGWTLLVFSGEKAPQTTPHHPPLIDIQATDYIALYECQDGKLRLIWYDEDLEPEEVRDLKQEEGKPCRQ